MLVVGKKSRTGKKMFKSAMKTDIGFESIEKKDLGYEGKMSLLERIKCFLVCVKLLIIFRNELFDFRTCYFSAYCLVNILIKSVFIYLSIDIVGSF